MRLMGGSGISGSGGLVIFSYGKGVGYSFLGSVSVSTAGGASSSCSMVVVAGITDDGKGGSLSLSTGSGGAMSLRVRSSMINEGVYVRMLAGSIFGYNKIGGFSIVSVVSSETCIGGNVEFLSRG